MLKTLQDTSKFVDQWMQDILNMSVIVHRIIIYGPIVVVCITSQFFWAFDTSLLNCIDALSYVQYQLSADIWSHFTGLVFFTYVWGCSLVFLTILFFWHQYWLVVDFCILTASSNVEILIRWAHNIFKVDSHKACRSPAMPCRWGFRMCLSHLIYTVWPCLIHTCHAAPMPCSDHAVLPKATAQYGCQETACGVAARVWLLPATTRISMTLLSGAYQSQMQVASVKPNTICHGQGKEW
jgi:hypothetical protein